MDISATHSSNSSSSGSIFLSFTAETRTEFTDHLYTALCNAGYHPFRDKDDIIIGHLIEPQLKRAIQQSTLSIVVISEHYGCSKWCLDELLYILQRKKLDDGYKVVPVFHHVQPRDVGNQKGSFEEAFNGFLVNGEHSKEKIDQWREALKEVSKIAGKVLSDKSHGYESEVIKEIVEIVGTTSQQKVLNIDSYTVGIESRVKDIDMLLKDDVGIGVICGRPGIGKTKIAEVAYNRHVAGFEASSFVSVRGATKEKLGLLGLRTQLISDISKGKKKKIDNTHEGTVKDVNATSLERFLIMLDGVDHIEQVDALIPAGDVFVQQSKIIITTSHAAGLLSNRKHKTCSVKPLDYHESLQLFSVHAFLQKHPTECFMELSKRVVAHCEGIPLSLIVMGSSLHGKPLEFWVRALEKLEANPDERIQKILQLSYKLLVDQEQKLFLTIASSFVGEDIDGATKMLEKHDFYSKVGMRNLTDRSFIAVDNDNKLIMHPAVLVMARAITDQETVDCSWKSNLYNSSGTKSETDISNGSLLRKNNNLGKRKREDESVPPKVHSSNSFKRFCLGFFSLFEPTTCFKKLFTRGGTQLTPEINK